MRALVLILVMILCPATALADTCIHDKTHHQWYFLWFQTGEELMAEGETWIGQDRVAVIEEERKMILDLQRNVFIYINFREKAFVEMALPLDRDAVFTEELNQWYAGNRVGGEVTPLDTSLDILGYRCTEYDCTFWDYRDGAVANTRSMKVWGTTEVEADLALFDRFLHNWRLIHNRDRATCDALARIKGVQLGLEWEKGETVRNEKIVNRVVKVGERTPPHDTYEVPAGFSPKPRLTVSDFQGF